jgi:hypothetical protein
MAIGTRASSRVDHGTGENENMPEGSGVEEEPISSTRRYKEEITAIGLCWHLNCAAATIVSPPLSPTLVDSKAVGGNAEQLWQMATSTANSSSWGKWLELVNGKWNLAI